MKKLIIFLVAITMMISSIYSRYLYDLNPRVSDSGIITDYRTKELNLFGITTDIPESTIQNIYSDIVLISDSKYGRMYELWPESIIENECGFNIEYFDDTRIRFLYDSNGDMYNVNFYFHSYDEERMQEISMKILWYLFKNFSFPFMISDDDYFPGFMWVDDNSRLRIDISENSLTVELYTIM